MKTTEKHLKFFEFKVKLLDESPVISLFQFLYGIF